MKWRVLLELTEANGHVQTREMVTGARPTKATSPKTIGLTLAESKSVLAAMQAQLVQAQADEYCQHLRKCAHCGSRRGIKDWRTRQLTTLFGGVEVVAPRFNPCRLKAAGRKKKSWGTAATTEHAGHQASHPRPLRTASTQAMPPLRETPRRRRRNQTAKVVLVLGRGGGCYMMPLILARQTTTISECILHLVADPQQVQLGCRLFLKEWPI